MSVGIIYESISKKSGIHIQISNLEADAVPGLQTLTFSLNADILYEIINGGVWTDEHHEHYWQLQAQWKDAIGNTITVFIDRGVFSYLLPAVIKSFRISGPVVLRLVTSVDGIGTAIKWNLNYRMEGVHLNGL